MQTRLITYSTYLKTIHFSFWTW